MKTKCPQELIGPVLIFVPSIHQYIFAVSLVICLSVSRKIYDLECPMQSLNSCHLSCVSCSVKIYVPYFGDDLRFFQSWEFTMQGNSPQCTFNCIHVAMQQSVCMQYKLLILHPSGVDFRVLTKSVVFKKLNVCSEVRTVRVKLLTGNTNCFRVVLKCKPKDLIGCNKPSATVCIQGN